MVTYKANLKFFDNHLKIPSESIVPTVFRLLFRPIRVGCFPLEKTPGGFWFQLSFRILFPKPPWNLFYINNLMSDNIRHRLQNITLGDVSIFSSRGLDGRFWNYLLIGKSCFSPHRDPRSDLCRHMCLFNLYFLISIILFASSFVLVAIVLDLLAFMFLQGLFPCYTPTLEIRLNFDCAKELWLHQFGFCWIEMSRLHIGLVKYWRQDSIGINQIWRLRNTLARFTWETVKLLVVMLKRITESKYFRKTLVRKFWCHCVYTSELYLDTLGLMLRFVKRSFSHKLLHTNRNKEKSNMKLDNNGSSDRLASKTTLQKTSSNSLLLYFS